MQESDPVYRVLGQLIKAGCPQFILSCRAADWRGGTARQDISEEYGIAPREMTLEPFSRESAIEFLVPTLGAMRAAEVIGYLEEKAIPDLYGNPLTLRAILLASDTTYHLRTLLLGVIRGSKLAIALSNELHCIMLNDGGSFGFGERYDAGQAIIALDQHHRDWSTIVEQLDQAGDENSTRLALELMDDVGFEQFTAQQIARSILAHLGLLRDVDGDEAEHHTIGSLSVTARHLPDEQVAAVLNELVECLPVPDPGADYRMRFELAEEDRNAISAFIQRAHDLRRTIQHHLIFVERDHDRVWDRIWRLGEISNALSPSADDIIHLLGLLAAKPERGEDDIEIWRELAAFARRIDDRANDILDMAQAFAKGRVELEEHLAELARPLPPPDWKVREDLRRRRREREKKKAWAKNRQDFSDNIESLRAGDLRWSLAVSQAYLGLFRDPNYELAPPDRIGQWLGPEVQVAALAGLEAVLMRPDLPTLQQIAESYAESRRWNFVHPMIAGVVERLRNGRTLDDVPIEVVIGVRIALDNEHLGDRIDSDTVLKQIDAFLRRDPLVYERYIRLLIMLERLKEVIEAKSPMTTDDLLAIIRYTLKRLQKELHGNDTDSIGKYWDDSSQPREEDRCTDALIEDMQRLLPSHGIGRTPQADMPNGKIADIIYTIGDAALPIECKGQWNPKL